MGQLMKRFVLQLRRLVRRQGAEDGRQGSGIQPPPPSRLPYTRVEVLTDGDLLSDVISKYCAHDGENFFLNGSRNLVGKTR